MKASLSGTRHQKLLATAAYLPIVIILVFIALMILTMILSEVWSTQMIILLYGASVVNLVIIICAGIFIKHVTKNSCISTGAKVGWVLYMVFFHAIALPDYWKKQVRRIPRSRS